MPKNGRKQLQKENAADPRIQSLRVGEASFALCVPWTIELTSRCSQSGGPSFPVACDTRTRTPGRITTLASDRKEGCAIALPGHGCCEVPLRLGAVYLWSVNHPRGWDPVAVKAPHGEAFIIDGTVALPELFLEV